MKDIYIKDEGDFVTVCFQTPKAIKVLNSQSAQVRNAVYSQVGKDSDYKKLDVDIDNVHQLVAFAISHDLTFDSEVPVTIPKKPDWFDRQRQVEEHRRMSGDDSVLGNPAY